MEFINFSKKPNTSLKLYLKALPLINYKSLRIKMDNLKNYKFGVFYYNPSDPRLLVPKTRSSIHGYTLNFAKPISSVILGLFLFPAVALLYLIFRS